MVARLVDWLVVGMVVVMTPPAEPPSDLLPEQRHGRWPVRRKPCDTDARCPGVAAGPALRTGSTAPGHRPERAGCRRGLTSRGLFRSSQALSPREIGGGEQGFGDHRLACRRVDPLASL